MGYIAGRCKPLIKDPSTALQPPLKERRQKDAAGKRKEDRARKTACGGLGQRVHRSNKEINTPKVIQFYLCQRYPSMRALVLLPLLLCTVVGVIQVKAEVNAVKLCGREFLRAVVYTCGGSRWRRFLSEPEMDGPPTAEQGSLETVSSSLGSELNRRNINNILTNVCCQVGCRKSDLTFLC